MSGISWQRLVLLVVLYLACGAESWATGPETVLVRSGELKLSGLLYRNLPDAVHSRPCYSITAVDMRLVLTHRDGKTCDIRSCWAPCSLDTVMFSSTFIGEGTGCPQDKERRAPI